MWFINIFDILDEKSALSALFLCKNDCIVGLLEAFGFKALIQIGKKCYINKYAF